MSTLERQTNDMRLMPEEMDGKPIPETNGTLLESNELKTYPMGWRHIVTLLAFVGFFCMYSMRINLGVALVSMVDHEAVAKLEGVGKQSSICVRDDGLQSNGLNSINSTNTTSIIKKGGGKYVWNSHVQGVILSSFFYGYIMTQFIGGVIAGKYGAKWVFGVGNVMTAVFTLLSPIAAEWGLSAFILVRVMQGFSSGVTWPSMQAFFSRWAPPSERSFLPAIAYAGSFIGTPLTFLFSGILIDSGFMDGWPSVFYVFGILCCAWFIAWALFASSDPETHRYISRGEQAYITKSIQALNTGVAKPGLRDVPWSQVLRSTAVWATVVAHFSYNWGLYTLMTTLPMYFSRVQGFDIKKNGFLSALPYIVQFIVHISSGRLADTLRVKFNLQTVHVRKAFDCLGHFLPAISVVCLGYVGCNENLAIALLVSTVAFTGLCGAGWFVNFLDIAPQFAGILFGVSNTFATIPGIVGPYLTKALTSDNTIDGWRVAFSIIAVLYGFSSIFFLIFGQGNIQPWAMGSKEIRLKKINDASDNEKTNSVVPRA